MDEIKLNVPAPEVRGTGIFLLGGLSPEEIRTRLADQKPTGMTNAAWQEQVARIVSDATRKD